MPEQQQQQQQQQPGAVASSEPQPAQSAQYSYLDPNFRNTEVAGYSELDPSVAGSSGSSSGGGGGASAHGRSISA